MIEFYWEDFDKAVNSLARKIRKEVEYDLDYYVLYGNPRGGLCLAVALSHELDIELTTNIEEHGKKIIWVDEIIDSGETLLEAMNELDSKCLFVAWMIRGDEHEGNVICHNKLEHDEWILFPWENKTKIKQEKDND